MDRDYSLIIIGGGIVGMKISREAVISKKFKNQFHILNSNSPAWTSSLKPQNLLLKKY